MKFINIPVFIISLAVGIFLVYISNQNPDIIYVYPKPDNVDQLQYRDKSNTCFRFDSQEVSCPADEDLVGGYPVQHSDK